MSSSGGVQENVGLQIFFFFFNKIGWQEEWVEYVEKRGKSNQVKMLGYSLS